MFWYSLLAVIALLFVLSVSLPVPRRIWAFSLITQPSISGSGCSDVIGVRKLILFVMTGRGAKSARLTRPQMLRMFFEDLGPTYIKFGQLVASCRGCSPRPTARSSGRASTA